MTDSYAGARFYLSISTGVFVAGPWPVMSTITSSSWRRRSGDKNATIGVKAGGAMTHYGKEVHGRSGESATWRNSPAAQSSVVPCVGGTLWRVDNQCKASAKLGRRTKAGGIGRLE